MREVRRVPNHSRICLRTDSTSSGETSRTVPQRSQTRYSRSPPAAIA